MHGCTADIDGRLGFGRASCIQDVSARFLRPHRRFVGEEAAMASGLEGEARASEFSLTLIVGGVMWIARLCTMLAGFLFMLILTCSTTAAQDYQDVVHLKNGTVVRGVIVEHVPDESVRIRTLDGSVWVFDYEEVARITREEMGGVSGLGARRSTDGSAAFPRGTQLVSGVLSFSSQGGDLYENFDGDGITTVSIVPSVFYFVTPSIGIGGDLSLTRQSQGDFSNTVWGAGPKAGYFFNSGSSTIPYVAVGWNYLSIGASNGDESESEGGTRWKFAGGVLLRRDHLGIVMELGYSRDSFSVEGFDGDNESFAGSIISLGIGFAGLLY